MSVSSLRLLGYSASLGGSVAILFNMMRRCSDTVEGTDYSLVILLTSTGNISFLECTTHLFQPKTTRFFWKKLSAI